ncbi:hypothetical protein Tco_0443322 [Tanacetum coccineum]
MMDRLSYSADKLDKGGVNLCELINMMKDMVRLLDSTSVFEKVKAEGEKVSLKEEMALELAKEAKAKAAEEAKIVYKAKANTQGEPQPINTTSSKEAKVEAQGEQSSKAPPVTELIPHFTDSLFNTTSFEYSPTPPRDKNKGKGIAIEEEPVKHLMPLIEKGGSDPKMLNLQ